MDTEEWSNNHFYHSSYKKLFISLKNENKFIIGYSGGHAISNALEFIVEAANLLVDHENIVFIFIGDGTEKERLKKQSFNSNLYFLDSIPKDSIPNFLKQCDILILSWHKSSLYKYGISPNKIFDYMMAEKPIIHPVQAGNDPVKQAGAGVSVEPENPQAIIDAILKINSLSSSELSMMGKNGRDFVLKNHDYKILAKKFIEVIS